MGVAVDEKPKGAGEAVMPPSVPSHRRLRRASRASSRPSVARVADGRVSSSRASRRVPNGVGSSWGRSCEGVEWGGMGWVEGNPEEDPLRNRGTVRGGARRGPRVGPERSRRGVRCRWGVVNAGVPQGWGCIGEGWKHPLMVRDSGRRAT